MPCPWAVNDRPVRVEVNESSGVPSGRVQVTGVLVKDRVEHESAKLTLVVMRRATSNAVTTKNRGGTDVRDAIGGGVDRMWNAPLRTGKGTWRDKDLDT